MSDIMESLQVSFEQYVSDIMESLQVSFHALNPLRLRIGLGHKVTRLHVTSECNANDDL